MAVTTTGIPLTKKRRSRVPRGIFAIGAIVFICWALSWIWRFSFRYYYFLAHFIRAASGLSVLNEACRRVSSQSWPFWNLSNADWYLLQRCNGIAWGYDRQGGVVPSIREIVSYAAGVSSLASVVVSQEPLLSRCQ